MHVSALTWFVLQERGYEWLGERNHGFCKDEEKGVGYVFHVTKKCLF